MKWDQVRDLVLTRTNSEAVAVRDGLGAQVLIVTDPMRAVRSLDLSIAASGRLMVPNAAHLFSRGGRGVAAVTPPGKSLGEMLRKYVFSCMVDSSGIGLLCDHIASADAEAVDGDIRRRSVQRDAVLSLVVKDLKGDLNKAAKLASKATALAVPVLDPEHSGIARVRQRVGSYFEGMRWGAAESMIARESLEVISERRLVVDRGHQDITDLTAKLRDLAEVHAQGPYFDRQQAFDAIRASRAGPRGFVRAGDDRKELLLQAADIAAGWGRSIIPTKGYRELARRFRCVLYNRRPLTPELAARLDDEISEHRKLVASFVGKV